MAIKKASKEELAHLKSLEGEMFEKNELANIAAAELQLSRSRLNLALATIMSANGCNGKYHKVCTDCGAITLRSEECTHGKSQAITL